MAKATPQSYQVTDKSPISYNGKVANCGDIVSDLVGEDISWLLRDGFIIVAPADSTTVSDPTPTIDPAPEAAPTPSETVASDANSTEVAQ